MNAVSGAMYVEIRDFFADFDLNLPGVRVVVLTGRGRHFCAGNDLPEFVEMTPENAPGRMKTVREAFWAIYDCPVPVIAAVNGAALGTGLAITASCDFAICGLSAQLGCPEVAIGVMGAAKHLSRLLPQPLVRYLYFNAEPMAAADMERFGAVLKVVARRGSAQRGHRHRDQDRPAQPGGAAHRQGEHEHDRVDGPQIWLRV